jgi:hypothetical protein
MMRWMVRGPGGNRISIWTETVKECKGNIDMGGANKEGRSKYNTRTIIISWDTFVLRSSRIYTVDWMDGCGGCHTSVYSDIIIIITGWRV